MFNDTLLDGLFDELEKIAKGRERGSGERAGRTIGAGIGGAIGAVPGAIVGGGLGAVSGARSALQKNPHLVKQIQIAQREAAKTRRPASIFGSMMRRSRKRSGERAAKELLTKMRHGMKVRGIGGALLGGGIGAAALGSITAPVGGDIGRAHD